MWLILLLTFAGCRSAPVRCPATCDSPRDSDRDWLDDVVAEDAPETEPGQYSLRDALHAAVKNHCDLDTRLQYEERICGDSTRLIVSVTSDAMPDTHFSTRRNLELCVLRAEVAWWRLLESQQWHTCQPAAVRDFQIALGLAEHEQPSAVYDESADFDNESVDLEGDIRTAIHQRPELLAVQKNLTFYTNLADEDEDSILYQKLVAAEEELDVLEQHVAGQVNSSWHELQSIPGGHVRLPDSPPALMTPDASDMATGLSSRKVSSHEGSHLAHSSPERIARAKYEWACGRLLNSRGIAFERDYKFGWIWHQQKCGKDCRLSRGEYIPREGDLILFTSEKPFWWDIAYAIARTGQPFHSALVVKRYDGSLALMEAGGTDDLIVTVSSVKNRMESRYAWEGKPIVWVRRIRRELTPDESAKLTRFAELRQGITFTSTYQLLGNFWTPADLMQTRTHQDQASWFCSEFVVQGAQCAGLLSWQIEPSNVSPRDLMYDSRLDISCLWESPTLWTVGKKLPTDRACCAPAFFPGR